MLTLAGPWGRRSLFLFGCVLVVLAMWSVSDHSPAGLAFVWVSSDGVVLREIAGPYVLLGLFMLALGAVILFSNSILALAGGQSSRAADDEMSKAREIEEASSRLDSSLGSVLEIMRATLTSTSNYSTLIKTAQRDLNQNSNPDAVKKTLQKVQSEHATISDEVDSLKGRLELAKAESEQLRRELQEARSESITDALTGLRNRKWFDACLQEEIAAAQKSSEDLCLAIIDIDHFKRVNDEFGHQTGDKILAWFGGKVLKNIKGRDCAARYGGEEFAIILPQTSLESAANLMDQIRKSVEEVNWTHIKSGRVIGHVTASFGVTQLRSDEEASSLLERADANMYAAKSEGRNRVVAR